MNYWQKRALTTRVATIQAAEANISDMARAFARTRDALIQQAESILASIDGDLAKAKQLLRSRELMQYRGRYGALLRQYLAGKDGGKAERILDLLYKQNRVNRLDSMIGQMELLSYELYGKMRGSIEDTLTYSAERGYYGTFHAAETRLHTGYEWAHIDEKKLTALLNEDWSGKLWSDRLWGHVWNFNAQLKDIITRGVLTGSPIRDIATELMGRTNQLRHRCETIVRTETAHVAGAATAMSYKEAGIDEYTYLATLDLKTSEICRSLDQKTFPLSEKQEGVNYPPMHPNCRSTTYFSITKNSHSMRAARDPVTGKSVEVPEDWDYGKWYKERVLKHAPRTEDGTREVTIDDLKASARGLATKLDKQNNPHAKRMAEFARTAKYDTMRVPNEYGVDIAYNMEKKRIVINTEAKNRLVGDVDSVNLHELAHYASDTYYHADRDKGLLSAIDSCHRKLAGRKAEIEDWFRQPDMEDKKQLADVFSAVFHGKIELEYGHSATYFSDPANRADEVFADLTTIHLLEKPIPKKAAHALHDVLERYMEMVWR